jgi:hypothetical protein
MNAEDMVIRDHGIVAMMKYGLGYWCDDGEGLMDIQIVEHLLRFPGAKKMHSI